MAGSRGNIAPLELVFPWNCLQQVRKPGCQHLNIPAQHHFLFLIVSVLLGKSDMSCLPSVSALFWSSANLNLLACSFGFLPQCPHMYGSKPRPHCPLANGKKHTWLCYISLDFAKLAKLNDTNSLPEHRGCASTMEFSSFKVYESTLFATMWLLSWCLAKSRHQASSRPCHNFMHFSVGN